MSSSHQSKFPCIIITIIIILLFFSSFSTLLTVNLFVLFWRCFVMLNSYFVCFIIYIFFFNFEFFFVDIIFVPKIGVCFSFYPVSLIFEYEAKPHIRWPHIREYEAGESGANFTSVLVTIICRFPHKNIAKIYLVVRHLVYHTILLMPHTYIHASSEVLLSYTCFCERAQFRL